MNMKVVLCRAAVSAAVLLCLGSSGAWAQTPAVRSRVVEPVDDSVTVRLPGNVHPLAKPQFDKGALPDSQPLTHMMLLLQRSTEQELALRQLLDAQLTKGSSSYHAWLTPAQFGKQFGPSDSDVQAITDWLTQHGFQVNQVSAGKILVDFSGNAGQVRNAFQTEIHRFVVNGEEHFANVSDPAIPQALAPVVNGIAALHNFPKHSMMKKVGSFHRDGGTGQVTPLFTYTDTSGTAYAVGPADFAKIYNITGWPNVGSGQTIAISGQSNINLADVASFQSMFGLPNNPPTVTVNGPDPGLVGPAVGGTDESEQDLDVEWAGAVAPQANIILVVSETTIVSATQGIDLSAMYIIDNNLAPVMSESYGACEAGLGSGGNAFYYAMWQQAAAQGITVAIAAGDNGPAECDPYANDPDPNAANQGLAANGLASTPYNVAVGGTDFDQNPTNVGTYWSTTNAASTSESALGYIPETPWDDSACAKAYLAAPTAAPCTSVDTSGAELDLTAGAGGPSSCVIENSNGACTTNSSFPNGGYPKPAFQTSITPSDSVRDLPDISLFASNGENGSFYIVCESDANVNNAACNLTTSPTTEPADEDFIGVGGTSAATPSFAAIVALVNAVDLSHGGTGRQGNINYALYRLAASEGYPTPSTCNSSSFTTPATPAPSSCVFYDVTTGTNTVACDATSLNCSNQASGYGVLVDPIAAYNATQPGAVSGITEGTPAFSAVTGYDLATGLGSINVGNLLTAWPNLPARTATSTTLTTSSGATNTSGSNFSFTVTVSPAPPTGEAVALIAYSGAGGTGTVLGTIGNTSTSGSNTSSDVQLTLNGSGSTGNVTTNQLPPGTASLVASYGGDTTLAASTSTPLTVAVGGANSPSKTTLNWVGFNSSNQPVTSTSSQKVPYGSPYIVEIVVTNSSGQQCLSTNVPCPVGTITLTDNGNPLKDFSQAQNANATNIAKLNNQGLAEDQYIQLGVGSHSLQAAFTPASTTSTNYQASTSNTLSATITQASTSMLLSLPTSITSGASVTLTAYVTTNSSGAGPTGSVAFTSNGSSIGSASCASTAGTADITPPITQITAGTAYCIATLTTTISSLPPITDPGTPTIPRVPLVLALVSLLLFLLGLRWVPKARRRAYTYAGLLAIALLVGVVAGCGGGGGSGTTGGTRNIVANYPGDTNYTGSNASGQVVVQ